MYRSCLSMALLLLFPTAMLAKEASVWLTIVSDGDRKDRGAWCGDIKSGLDHNWLGGLATLVWAD